MVEQNNFNRRMSISRREPVIALEKTRIRGRNFKEGAHLDRRRTRMRNAHLAQLIREGVLILARDMSAEDLALLGFVYNPNSPRMKLTKLSEGTVLLLKTEHEKEKRLAESEKSTAEFVKTPEEVARKKAEEEETEADRLKNNQLEMDKLMAENEPEETPKDEPEVAKTENVSHETIVKDIRMDQFSNGWFNVYVDGEKANDKALRKADAEALVKEHGGVTND